MSWPYAYTPAVWPSVLTVLLLVALSIYAWRRRSVPGALPFAIAGLLDALWMAGYTLVIAAMDAAAKIFWLKFGSVWQAFGATAVTCFLLEYAWPGRWLTRRNLALLSIPPLLIMGLILTDDVHHLMVRGYVVDGLGVTSLVGPAGQVAVAYGVGLVLVNLVVFVWLFLRSPQHRWPVVLMLTGQIAVRVAFVAHVGEAIQSELLLNVLGVAFLFVMYAFALFGFRLFDPISLARQQVIAQMREGVLVVDPQGRVASLNPAAERILGAPAKQIKGKPVRELLPAYLDGPLADPSRTEIEFSLPEEGPLGRTPGTFAAGQAVRYYTLAISPLKDWRGLAVGRLLLLRDVTEQKQTEAQLLAQQWAQATLQERELLAQELHDGLAQNLGFLNLQAQAAQLYLRGGQGQAAQDSLARLAQVALEVQGDTRELIGNLLTISLPSEGFCSTLRHVLTRFEEQNGLHVSLDIEHEAEAGCDPSILPPAYGVQLLRIVQEALANVRKHAGGPTQISVRLKAQAGQLQLTVQDNGAGFDPAQTGADGQRFGLQVMRQRAERIGGQMAVHSAPGQGTRVAVCVPLGDDAETGRRGDAEGEDTVTRRRGDTESRDTGTR